MKAIELLKILQKINKSFYTIADLEKITGLPRNSLYVALKRWETGKIIERVSQGIYVPMGGNLSLENVAAQLYIPNYLSFVVPQDSPEGYFEYAAFAVLASQFYLDWHANYNDWQVLCNKDDVEANHPIVGGQGCFWHPADRQTEEGCAFHRRTAAIRRFER
jgi:hypothetical protein